MPPDADTLVDPASAPPTEELKAQETPPEGAPTEDAPEETPPAPSLADQAITAAVKEQLTKAAKALGIEGEFTSADELQAAVSASQARQAEQEVEQNLVGVIEDAYSDIFDALKGLKLEAAEDGSIALTDEQLQGTVGQRLAKAVDGLLGVATQDAYTTLGVALAQILPETDWPAFEKAAQGKDAKGISVSQWISLATESMAPHTKVWKDRELEHQTALAKAKADGWAEAQGAPGGQPTQSRQAGGTGKLTTEQFLSMSTEQQAVAWRERPEEVRALK